MKNKQIEAVFNKYWEEINYEGADTAIIDYKYKDSIINDLLLLLNKQYNLKLKTNIMKTHYLKSTKFNKKISTAIKITEKGVLYVTQNSIEIDELTFSDLDLEYAWYQENIVKEECTKEEFDNFFIDAVREINELSKL